MADRSDLHMARTYLKRVEGVHSRSYKSGHAAAAGAQWVQICKHFPEEHIPDSRPGQNPIPPGWY